MDKLFNIKGKFEKLKCKYIEAIRNAASQITLGSVDEYRKAIERYLKFVHRQIQDYLEKEKYYVITIYYSLLIEDLTKQRITIERKDEESYIKQLKRWYDNKFNNFEAFSLVPESLGKYAERKRLPEYLVKLKKINETPENVEANGDIREIPLYCYEKEDSLLNSLFKRVDSKISNKEILNKIFDEILEQLISNKDNLLKLFGDTQCLDHIKNCEFKMTNGKEITTEQLFPFIMLWYPIYKKGYYYQYYIPSPIYSNTLIGGLVIGTETLLNKEEIDNLEDIALKVSVDINLIEHKEHIEKLSIERGASIITASVAHNLRNSLKGFTASLEILVDKYPGIYIQGHSVENKINWLNIANPNSKFKPEEVEVRLLDLLIRAFNSAWEILLIRDGDSPEENEVSKKFKIGSNIVYPILKIIGNSEVNYYFGSIRYNTGDNNPTKFIKWDYCSIVAFREKEYESYQPLIICIFRKNAFELYSMESGNSIQKFGNVKLPYNNKIKIPKDAIAGLEGCFEEIFFNAFKYSNSVKPLCISCSLNDKSVEITNPLPPNYEQNDLSGILGNKAAFNKLGWVYDAKPVNSNFVSTINIR